MPKLKYSLKPSTVVVVGPLPPPVHGMAKNTAVIAEELRRRCNVVVADISPRGLDRRLAYHAKKIIKVLRALFVIAFRAHLHDARLYTPAHAGWGIYYTIAIVTTARFFGYKICS